MDLPEQKSDSAATTNPLRLTVIIAGIILVCVLGIAAYISAANKCARGCPRDAGRVADVKTLQMALGLYVADNHVYPSALNQIPLKYISYIPSDPITRQPYRYAVSEDGMSFTLCTRLENRVAVPANANNEYCVGPAQSQGPSAASTSSAPIKVGLKVTENRSASTSATTILHAGEKRTIVRYSCRRGPNIEIAAANIGTSSVLLIMNNLSGNVDPLMLNLNEGFRLATSSEVLVRVISLQNGVAVIAVQSFEDAVFCMDLTV